jgi:SAM-dependent methyltransferase
MKLSRDFTLLIHFLFDQCLPPLLRDSKWFMWLPFKLLFRDKAEIFFSFKEQAPFLTPEQFREIYTRAAPVFIQRETDLNAASIAAIEQRIVGESVLDIACGRGFLTKRLAEKYHVTGADIVIDPALAEANPRIIFHEANLENLPFADRQFDTVICAHTLEHVQHPAQAISELRRVCAKRLIVVVPRQRPYRYTFDLHLHFFPYAHDVLSLMGRGQCQSAGGDWLYWEER